MATDERHETAGRRRAHIALVVGCVLAAVFAALLVPTLASDEIAGSPIDSILPGERFESDGGGGDGGGFGALDPSTSTGVGGETGFDNATFGSNDTEVHFEVESPEPAYWRTGSYDTYTGTGWERDGETVAYDPPLSPVGLTDGEMEFEVTLAKPAAAVPTAWQPQRLSGVEGLQVTDSGAIRVTEALDAGTTITGVSQRQADDVDLLRAAGGEYPDAVTEQYTQLPADTPGRVESFTEQLTAAEETPYDTAMAIQNWLRNEKDYSLEADRQSDHIADTFIFEMEVGYCEYFATAMTTMLRSQDIPARYTVGYSTGQPVGENTYEVRGMNAHAWVEVYFPDVGWVKFDPTPGGSRLQTQSAVLEDELGEELDLQEPGSPGETFEPGTITDEWEPGNESDDGEWYDISLNRTAVPGLPVEIRVTTDGEPASDVRVTVNGDLVGTTDGDGTVVMTVPDEDELRINAQPARETFDTNETAALAPPGPTDGWGPSGGDRLFSQGAGSAELSLRQADNGTTKPGRNATADEEANVTRPLQIVEPEANTTVDVETGATVSVTGDTLPGETVTLTATVEDVAVPDATVFLDGEPVGTTDASGRAEVTLPAEPGNATLAIERGPVSGEKTVVLPELELSVSTGSLPLPFTSATATVTAGERNIAGAPVIVDGEEVATTGADGTAEVRLPLSRAATVETSSYGMSAAATVDGLLRNLALLVVGVGGLAAVAVRVVRGRDLSLAGLRRWLGATADRLLTYAQLALLGAARNGGTWLASLPGRLRTALASVADVLRGRVSPAELTAAFLAWLATKRPDRSEPVTEASEESVDVTGGIQQAWDAFLSHVSVADPAAHTPGELAAHAIEEDGLPAEPVEALLTAFRAVEYGSRPPKAHLDRARRALAALAAHTDPEPATQGTQSGHPTEEVTADGGTATGHPLDDQHPEESPPGRDNREPDGGSE